MLTPMSEQHPFVYLHDRLVDRSHARVDALSLGFLAGAGVFETVRVSQGRVLAWREHGVRLLASTAALSLPVPPSIDALREALDAVVAANELSEALVRVTWAAPADGVEQGILLVHSRPLPDRCRIAEADGLRTFISDVARAPGIAPHKSTSYHAAWRALSDARQRGPEWEALLADGAGYVWEGATTNLFVRDTEGWCTPPVDRCALAGIGRAATLRAASDIGIRIVERPVAAKDLHVATAAFLTSSSLGVAHVRSVGDRNLPRVPAVRRLADAVWSRWRDTKSG